MIDITNIIGRPVIQSARPRNCPPDFWRNGAKITRAKNPNATDRIADIISIIGFTICFMENGSMSERLIAEKSEIGTAIKVDKKVTRRLP